jgi:hypothetical protein
MPCRSAPRWPLMPGRPPRRSSRWPFMPSRSAPAGPSCPAGRPCWPFMPSRSAPAGPSCPAGRPLLAPHAWPAAALVVPLIPVCRLSSHRYLISPSSPTRHLRYSASADPEVLHTAAQRHQNPVSVRWNLIKPWFHALRARLTATLNPRMRSRRNPAPGNRAMAARPAMSAKVMTISDINIT